MGAWGTSAFENDTALDWVWQLKQSQDTSELVRALRTVLDLPDEEYLHVDYCSEAIAASEVIAATKGAPLPQLPDEVTTWLQSHTALYTPDLANQALAAIDRILTDSEAKDLWEEGEFAEVWHTAMAGLQ